jgi:D-sedoheptulose 7-phosphate isomerase
MSFDEQTTAARLAHSQLLDRFLELQAENLERLAFWCAGCLRQGGKLLLFGNGGSAAQAQHLAAEFMGQFGRPRQALAAIALTGDGAVTSCIANDSEFAKIFSRQIEALGNRDDLALAFSTTGLSPNVVEALRTARSVGLRTAALLGRDGGLAVDEVDLAVVVPGEDTARIQEIHLFAAHLLCERVEHLLED